MEVMTRVDSMTWLEILLDTIGSARVGTKWQCPVHGLTGEHSTSLAVGARRDGTGTWIYCHTGCSLEDILRALHLSRQALVTPPPVSPQRHAQAHWRGKKFPEPKFTGGSPQDMGFRYETEHQYGDFAWKVRYRHPRSGAKQIQWESRNPNGERVLGLLGRQERDLPLYRDKDISMAVATGEQIVLVESESSVDALNHAGLYATTWAGGAGSVPISTVREFLGEANVLFVPDHDDAGKKSMAKVKLALPKVRIKVGLPGEDARDVLKRLGPTFFTN